MSITFRPLDKAIMLIEVAKLEMTYAYEDLVFASHSLFILRFDDNDATIFHLHFNSDCEKEEKDRVFTALSLKASEIGVFIKNDAAFSISSETDSEELKIVFRELA